MRYQIIYEVIRDERGEVVDFVNSFECRTQSEVAKWLGCNQSSVSRASVKRLRREDVNECSPIHWYAHEYVVARG